VSYFFEATHLRVITFAALVNASISPAQTAPPSDSPADYMVKRQIVMSGTSTAAGDGLIRVKLPIEVFRDARHADLRDVRVFNGAGQRLPFAITYPAPRRESKRAQEKLPFFPVLDDAEVAATRPRDLALTVKVQPDGSLTELGGVPNKARQSAPVLRRVRGYLVDASRIKAPIGELAFDWVRAQTSQTGRIDIESSDDLVNWQAAVRSAPLIDIAFGEQRLQQTTVTMPPTRARYLLLTWEKEPFELRSIQYASETSSTVAPPLERLVVSGRAGPQPNEFLFDIGASINATRLRLQLPELNTLAPTQLMVQSTEQRLRPGTRQTDTVQVWKTIQSATFYRIARDGVELNSPMVSVASAGPVREWLARIDWRAGGTGNQPPTLELEWQAPYIVFAARGQPPFTIGSGRQNAAAGALAIANILPGYQTGDEEKLPLAQLETASRESPSGSASGAPVTGSTSTTLSEPSSGLTAQHRKWILWSALGLGVLVLATMARSVMRTGEGERK